MKISELESKLGISSDKIEYATMILNAADTPASAPTTYKIDLSCLAHTFINGLNLVMYDNTNNAKNLYAGTLNTSTGYLTKTNIGQYINSTDRTVLDSAVTDMAYDTTNKKITQTKYNNSTTDVVTTDQILTDMDLNVTDTADSTKYVSGVSETKGKITVSRTTFSPSITWTNAVAGTNDAKPTINISVAGNAATAQTPNEASTTVYGITKLSNDINSTSEVLAATPKAVKDAIESLDITQITNTAGKTVATIDEADGKVSATFQDISILSSQISDKGTAGNVATLDANGHVPASQLPSYVDDIVEGTLSTFPATGETGKIYVDTATNISYRWSGSQYVKVASDLALGETSSTAYAGDKGKAAYDHATAKGSAFTSGFYKITTNAEGHVTAATPVQANDILTLLPSWINNENPPSTFTTITIGNTTLDETQLTALLALLASGEEEE